MSASDDESPVSFAVNVSRLPRTGLPVWLEADDAQRAALAQGHGLLAVERFRLDATVSPWHRGGVKVAGRVAASIVQACIVSLTPVPAEIDEPFEAVFVPESSRLARPGHVAAAGELLLDAEGPDAPETFSGDHVDVGALAEEFFELAVDPYPRAPGAAFSRAEGGAGEDVGPLGEKLAKLLRGS